MKSNNKYSKMTRDEKDPYKNSIMFSLEDMFNRENDVKNICSEKMMSKIQKFNRGIFDKNKIRAEKMNEETFYLMADILLMGAMLEKSVMKDTKKKN
ncbi:hypothetical protein CDEF62S_02387 [Castellaniella defragrans]